MNLQDLLVAERVACREPEITSKKRALEKISEMLAAAVPKASAEQVFDCLLARERLGSTGLGHGVALPHARLPEARGAIGALLCLENGIDFDSADGQPVGLLFGLLVPENSTQQHLEVLACLAGLFRDPQLCEQMLRSGSPDALLALLKEHWPQVASS